MNIVFIVPCIRPYLDFVYYPIGISYITTVLYQKGYEFDIIDVQAHRHTDKELEEALSKKSYDVIALGSLVTGYSYIRNLLTIARKTNPEAVIVAGNSVASSVPEHLLTHTEADIAVKGEGEITMLKILNALERKTPLAEIPGIVFRLDGKIIDTGFEPELINVNELPLPNWDLYDINLYIEKGKLDVYEPYPMPLEQIRPFVVNTARGCSFRCTFCYHVFSYTRYRYRSAESILSEIRVLNEKYGVNYVNFHDELTFLSRRQVKDFVDAVLASGLKFFWTACIRGNLFSDRDMELLHRMKASGCLDLGYSLESGNPGILKAMKKRMNIEDFEKQKRALDKAEISSGTSLVLGYPQETIETLKQTFDICYELDLYPSVGYLLPQPATPMFEIAKEKCGIHDMEEYLMRLGDRQDLRFNLTDIPTDVFKDTVDVHLLRISDKLGLGLEKERLVKTVKLIYTKDETSDTASSGGQT